MESDGSVGEFRLVSVFLVLGGFCEVILNIIIRVRGM